MYLKRERVKIQVSQQVEQFTSNIWILLKIKRIRVLCMKEVSNLLLQRHL